jgi:hypothetical protein
MNTTIRNDEKAVTETKPETDASFQRLSRKIKKEESKRYSPPKLKISQNAAGVVQKKTEAFIRNLNISQSQWLKKHGMVEGRETATISKQIFAMLDLNRTGEIPADDFLDFLIEIGIPLDHSVVKKVMIWTLKVKDLRHATISLQVMNQFCRGDKRSDQVLKVFEDRLGKDFKGLEAVGLVNTWWDSLGLRTVTVKTLSEFLVKKRVFNDFSEAKKYLSKINRNEVLLDHFQFLCIFGKTLVRHTLVNINKKFDEDDWNNPVYSLPYKLCQLKKQLILAGIKYPIQHISYEEGLEALKAIENLQKFKEPKKFQLEEFKEDWFKLTGQILYSNKAEKIKEVDVGLDKTQRKLAVFIPRDDLVESRKEIDVVRDRKNELFDMAELVEPIFNNYKETEPLRPSLYSTKQKSQKRSSSRDPKHQVLSSGLKDFQNLVHKLV